MIQNLEICVHKGDHAYELLSKCVLNFESCIEQNENSPNTLVNMLSRYENNDSKIRQVYENDAISIFSSLVFQY